MQTPIVLAVICLTCTPWTTTYKANNEPLPTKVILSEEDIKIDLFLNKLSQCESSGNERAIHKMDGNSDSLGMLQFKIPTFMHYVNRYELPYTESDIWSGDKQLTVAKLMLKENKNNQNHWYNCSKVVGRL